MAYLNWYLHATSKGGYCAAHDTGVALVTVSRYLVAKGRIDPTSGRSWRGAHGICWRWPR